MDNFNQFGYNQPSAVMTQEISKVMRGVYMRMCLALVVTGLVSFFVAAEGSLVQLMATSRLFFWGLIIAEFGVVIAISGALHKMSSATASLLSIFMPCSTG